MNHSQQKRTKILAINKCQNISLKIMNTYYLKMGHSAMFIKRVIIHLMKYLGISILFQIKNFIYEIINEEFEKDKVCVFILKFSILTTLKTMV